MTEKPILFSGDMVRAILDDRKTQTRRAVGLREFGKSETVGYSWTFRDRRGCWNDVNDAAQFAPYQPGDRLWVRETWCCPQAVTYYRASDEDLAPPGSKWKPSIHMPKWAARIWLEVVSVRLERLHDISEGDAKAEGIAPGPNGYWKDYSRPNWSDMDPVRSFAGLWDSLMKSANKWASNPWVWVIEFRRASP